MLPVLFSYGSLTVQTMSLFYVLSFLAAAYVFWRKGVEEHYAEDELFDGFLLSFLVGVAWSRVGFIVLHLQYFGVNLFKWLDVFGSPGMVPLAGLLAGGWYLHSFAKKKRWDVFEVMDFSVLAMGLAFVVLSIGAFISGIGFGTPTKLPVGMNFPGVFDTRHPIQLYSAVWYLLAFLYLNWVELRYRTFSWYKDKRHSAQSGFLFAVFLMLYGVFGVVLSFLSAPQLVLMGFNIDLPVKILIFLYGVGLLYTRTGRKLPLVGR